MFKKEFSAGLILLLLLGLCGCQAEGASKNVVYSKEQKSADETKNAAPVQQAVKKAEDAFTQYLNIQDIDKSLLLKVALIEDDGVLWMNPYWKLNWVGKDDKKPVYSAEIDAQSGEVVQLLHRQRWGHKTISREEVLKYQDTALAFIKKFDLVKEAHLTLFEASSSYTEGIYLEFRYATDRFIKLYFNEAGDVTGFERSQQVWYALPGNDLKIDRTRAIDLARASIKQYYGEVDTSGLIERIQLVEGNKGQKTWFVFWKNIAVLDGRDIVYGAQIDALNGKVLAVEGVNHSNYNTAPQINEQKLREIADKFLQQKNLSGYRFETFVKDTGSLRYRDKAGSPLHVYVDRNHGYVCFLSFFEFD